MQELKEALEGRMIHDLKELVQVTEICMLIIF